MRMFITIMLFFSIIRHFVAETINEKKSPGSFLALLVVVFMEITAIIFAWRI